MQKEITIEEFASQVQSMRKAQKDYFRFRSKASLKTSLQLEKNIDDRIMAILKNQPFIVQKELFT